MTSANTKFDALKVLQYQQTTAADFLGAAEQLNQNSGAAKLLFGHMILTFCKNCPISKFWSLQPIV